MGRGTDGRTETGISLILRLDTFHRPFAAAGALDPSFSGDGKAVVNAPPGTLSDEFRTVIQSDGKIVAAGYVGGDVAVVRFNPDGTLDASFDSDGIAITDFGGSNDKAHDVTVQPDGKIVVAGGGGSDLIVGRYNVDGSLDASFDGDGKVKRDFGAGDQALAVEVDAAGKVVLAGGTNDAPPLGDLLVVRLNADGSLDATFDADGSRVIDLGDKTLGLGLALDRGGRAKVEVPPVERDDGLSTGAVPGVFGDASAGLGHGDLGRGKPYVRFSGLLRAARSHAGRVR